MDTSARQSPAWSTRIGGVVGPSGPLFQSPGEAAALADEHDDEGASFVVVDAGQHDLSGSVAAVRAAVESLDVMALVSAADQVDALGAAGVDGIVDATGPGDISVAQATAANSISLMVSVGATTAPAPERALALSAKLAAAEAAGLSEDRLAVLEVLDPTMVRRAGPVLDLGRPTALLVRSGGTDAQRVAAQGLAASMGFGMILARDVRAARRSVHLIDTVVDVHAGRR